MATWIQDPETGDLLDPDVYQRRVAERRGRCRTGSPFIISDWRPDEAVVSPVDGTMLTCRADVREHNIRNDCIDVGNDRSHGKGNSMKRESAKPMMHEIAQGFRPVLPACGVFPEE